MSQLPGFGEVGVGGVVDGLCRPDTHMTICKHTVS